MSEFLTPALAEVRDQPTVVDFFTRALTAGKLGHAYLLTGNDTLSLQGVATALAQARVAPTNDPEALELIAAGAHPDALFLEPGSAVGYLVDQVRELIDAAALTPALGAGKAFVLASAHKLTGASANALLKTLEEPEGAVTFVLCAPAAEAVLPTLVSRCQVVPFASLTRERAIARIAELAQVDEVAATRAFEVAGDVAAGVRFASDPLCQELVALLDPVARGLGREVVRGSAWDMVVAARDAAAAISASGGDLDEAFAAQEKANEDFLSAGAKKEREKRHKREMNQRERDAATLAVSFVAWRLDQALLGSSSAGAAAMRREVFMASEKAKDTLRSSVAPVSALERLLLELWEASCRLL
jgi:DNA polymerase-3 subunit delta'